MSKYVAQRTTHINQNVENLLCGQNGLDQKNAILFD